MNIQHFPITNTDKVCELYSEKDGVPVKYVCTTDFHGSHDDPADIFYRETPHPEFGNKYFGLRFRDSKLYIYNADTVDGLTFGIVEDDDGHLQYSQYHHDFKSFNNGNMIDGGRSYIRSSGKVDVYKVQEGEMVLC
jgi:glutamine cyclotransferase